MKEALVCCPLLFFVSEELVNSCDQGRSFPQYKGSVFSAWVGERLEVKTDTGASYSVMEC